MSYSGDYVVVGGTGVNLYYFAGCTKRSGSAESQTWLTGFWVSDFYAVKISPNGEYVAAGGRNSTHGFVVFYKDATTASGTHTPLWVSWSSITAPIIDLALSDDGYSVVAVDETIEFPEGPATLYYWADATNLSEDPEPTWTRNRAFYCVGMSCDGNEVIAGTAPIGPCGLHFWADARELSGYEPS
jgi:hypothetical protein